MNLKKRIRNAPWKAVKSVVFTVRKAIINKQVPDEEYLVIDANIAELSDMLRHRHYREGWVLSWYYMGEDENLCRAEYDPGGDIQEYQHHIRLFRRGPHKTVAHTHYEIDPIPHPKKHIKGVDKQVGKGVEMMKEALDSEGIGYETRSN